ncbi:hypothetical protein M5689_011374 [Euphorbia peplus]|nr:hypothetical protein M5689_011374 [Euphorbia peplus]
MAYQCKQIAEEGKAHNSEAPVNFITTKFRRSRLTSATDHPVHTETLRQSSPSRSWNMRTQKPDIIKVWKQVSGKDHVEVPISKIFHIIKEAVSKQPMHTGSTSYDFVIVEDASSSSYSDSEFEEQIDDRYMVTWLPPMKTVAPTLEPVVIFPDSPQSTDIVTPNKFDILSGLDVSVVDDLNITEIFSSGSDNSKQKTTRLTWEDECDEALEVTKSKQKVVNVTPGRTYPKMDRKKNTKYNQ